MRRATAAAETPRTVLHFRRRYRDPCGGAGRPPQTKGMHHLGMHNRPMSRLGMRASSNRHRTATGREFEVLLEHMLSTDEDIRDVAASDERLCSLSFLLWLSDLEVAGDDRKQKISELGAQLVALREGLDPPSREELSAASDQEQEQPVQEGSLAVIEQSGAFAIQVQRAASLALTPEGSAILESKASELREGMDAAKRQSALELMGRQVLPTLEEARAAERASAAADASGRILRVILEMGSRADRRAILPEAFTPPSEADCVDSEEEMLATTPFALLSAVDMELARFSRQISGLPRNTMLPGDAAGCDIESVLRELREDIYEYIELHR